MPAFLVAAALIALSSGCTTDDTVAFRPDACTPQAEICSDGVDNDCDGEVDEPACEPGEFPDRNCEPDGGVGADSGATPGCEPPPDSPCVEETAVLYAGMNEVFEGRVQRMGNDFASTRCGGTGIDTEDYAILFRACDEGRYEVTPVTENPALGEYSYIGDPCRPTPGGCSGSFSCGSRSVMQTLDQTDQHIVVFDGPARLNGGFFRVRVRWVP